VAATSTRPTLAALRTHHVGFAKLSAFAKLSDGCRSHFYIASETIELVDKFMNGGLSDSAVLDLVAQSSEFAQLKLREDEVPSECLPMHAL